MSALARYIVDAILLEHRSPGQVARDHDISRIYRLPERFKEGGYEALERCRSDLPEGEGNIDSLCLDAVPNANLAAFGTEGGRAFASWTRARPGARSSRACHPSNACSCSRTRARQLDLRRVDGMVASRSPRRRPEGAPAAR